MRKKNESIHLFILDEDRKKSAREHAEERILKEWLHAGRQPIKPLPNPIVIQDMLSKEEANTLGEKSQLPSEEQKTNFKVTEHAKTGSAHVPSKTGVWLERISNRACRNVKVGLGVPTVMVACSIISIIALLQLDAVYGLQSGLESTIPYWIAIRITLGMLGLMIIDAIVFQVYVLKHKSGRKEADAHCKKYALPSGSTIRAKSMAKSVKRPKRCCNSGKHVYSIETGNMVEVLRK